MSTPKKKQQTTDTITAALDAIAEGLASDIISAVAAKRVLDSASAATVGSFLLAYRRERDERTTRARKMTPQEAAEWLASTGVAK